MINFTAVVTRVYGGGKSGVAIVYNPKIRQIVLARIPKGLLPNIQVGDIIGTYSIEWNKGQQIEHSLKTATKGEGQMSLIDIAYFESLLAIKPGQHIEIEQLSDSVETWTIVDMCVTDAEGVKLLRRFDIDSDVPLYKVLRWNPTWFILNQKHVAVYLSEEVAA